jgi:hypothetical protein
MAGSKDPAIFLLGYTKDGQLMPASRATAPFQQNRPAHPIAAGWTNLYGVISLHLDQLGIFAPAAKTALPRVSQGQVSPGSRESPNCQMKPRLMRPRLDV